MKLFQINKKYFSQGIDFLENSTILYIIEFFLIMEKQKRSSVEKKIDNRFFRLKLGTVNRMNPEVIYLEGKTFIIPIDEDRDYSNTLKVIRKGLSRIVNNALFNNKHFKSNYILDLQVANSGVILDKKSFLTFQLLLRQKSESINDLKRVKSNCESFFNSITNELSNFIKEHGFVITKTKKEPVTIF